MSASLRIFNAIKQSRGRIAQATTSFRLPCTNPPQSTVNFTGRFLQSGMCEVMFGVLLKLNFYFY